VDYVERQRAPISGSACSTAAGASLLGHLVAAGGVTRRVPVANVQPIMKDATRMTSGSTSTSSSDLSGCRLSPPLVDDSSACSQMSSSGRSSLEGPGAAKDVTALLAAGLSRGGRVSSHHMEYVRFLSRSVDDAASLASTYVPGAALGGHHARPTGDRRRGSSTRGGGGGGLANLSAKARRQLLPYFQPGDDDRQPPAAAASNKPSSVIAAASGGKTATTDARNTATAVVVAAGSSTVEHGSGTCPSSGTSGGRKTTPVVYFDDDDESTETSSSSGVALTSGTEHPTAKHWRHGPSTVKRSSGKPRKTVRTVLCSVDGELASSDGTHGVVSKRRKRVAGVKTSRVNDGKADNNDDDDDLTDFEDALPSTSAQVSLVSCFRD